MPSSMPATTTPPRFYILDFVRLVAMMLMMQGHSLDALVAPEHLNFAEFPWNVWHFLRGLTAPTFLLLSGAVQVFASKRDENGSISHERYMKQIRWAITLMGIGYLLVFPASRLRDLPFVTPEGWRFFFQVNILQLSGLTLIALMTVMRFTRSNQAFAKVSLWIGLAIMVVSPLVHQVDWFTVLPEALAAFVSFKHGSLFFIFPFSAYMFFGVSVGAWLESTPAEERITKFPRVTGLVGIAAIAVGLLGTYLPISMYPQHDYYLASPNFVLLRVGCTLLLMSLLTFVYRFTQIFEEYYSRLGKKSLYIYTSHLILLFGTPWFGGITRVSYRTMDIASGALVAAAVVVATLFSAYLLDYYQRNSQSVRQGLRFSLTAMLLYALLV